MPRILSVLIAAGGLLLAAAPVGAGATAYNKIVVFGDSQSDVGNFYLATGSAWPASPYYKGRFSNDSLWVEHLASTYGLTDLTPNTDTSTPTPG